MSSMASPSSTPPRGQQARAGSQRPVAPDHRAKREQARAPRQRAAWHAYLLQAEVQALAKLLVDRVSSPDDCGPPIDNEGNERPEDTFVEVASNHDYLVRLSLAVALALESSTFGRPEVQRAGLLSIFALVEQIGRPEAAVAIKRWLRSSMRGCPPAHAEQRPKPFLIELWVHAVAAIAASQPAGSGEKSGPAAEEWESYWRGLWDQVPELRPQVFIGLRLCSVSLGLDYVERLLREAADHRQNAAPYLYQFWRAAPSQFLHFCQEHRAGPKALAALRREADAEDRRSIQSELARLKTLSKAASTRPAATSNPPRSSRRQVFRVGPADPAQTALLRALGAASRSGD
ncbi:MAG TPA: hypothetical protein VJN18_22880 [Polyangiaceae bacterium]|nr:hypothetical protein [Polyangiaceae bacterium]